MLSAIFFLTIESIEVVISCTSYMFASLYIHRLIQKENCMGVNGVQLHIHKYKAVIAGISQSVSKLFSEVSDLFPICQPLIHSSLSQVGDALCRPISRQYQVKLLHMGRYAGTKLRCQE
jgi:hypothetical protein